MNDVTTQATVATTIEQIRAAEVKAHKEYEARTTAFECNSIRQTATGYENYTRVVTIAEARSIFDECLKAACLAPEYWKSPFRVIRTDVVLAVNAIEFFHGGRCEVTAVGMPDGQKRTPFAIVTRGYAG